METFGTWQEFHARILEIVRDSGDIATKPDWKSPIRIRGDLRGGIENHLAQRPAHFRRINLVDRLEGVKVSLVLGMREHFLGSIVT